MTKLSDYAKTAEPAEFLGVSQNTWRAWAEAGKIPVHRNPANGYRLFLKADLEKFLRPGRNEQNQVTKGIGRMTSVRRFASVRQSAENRENFLQIGPNVSNLVDTLVA